MPAALPVLNPSAEVDDIFYKVLEHLTHGVVTDFRTLIFALILLGCILFGFNLFYQYLESLALSASFQRASGYAERRDGYSAGSAGYDYYNALYHKQLNQAVSLSKSDDPKSVLSVAKESSPTVFLDGSSPETPASDWESFSLAGEGYVGFSVPEEDQAPIDRSDWTLMQEADITGLEVDSASSFSSDRSDWTAVQESEITGLEMEPSSGSSSEKKVFSLDFNDSFLMSDDPKLFFSSPEYLELKETLHRQSLEASERAEASWQEAKKALDRLGL